MTLLSRITSRIEKPSYQVYVAGQSIQVLSVQCDSGWDVVSSSAIVISPNNPAITQLRTELEVWLGYSGFTFCRFRGYITDVIRSYFPYGYQIRASGYSKLTQNPYPVALFYENETELDIATDLISRAGIVDATLEGDDTVLGTVQPVRLEEGSPPSSLLSLMADSFGYKVFDGNDGYVHRQFISGRPATSAAFAYVQGTNILSIVRQIGSVDQINNRVDILGLDQGVIPQWPVSRLSENPLVPDPPGFIPAKLPSDLIETEEVAEEQALRIISDVNGIPDQVAIESWGNPYINPGVTISVTSEKEDLAIATNYLVKHISDRVDARGGYKQRIVAERRIGNLGTLLGRPPIASFVYRVTQETFEISGTPTTVYTVSADASASFDRDSPPDTLTYSWSNNKNADVGTGVLYVTRFTQVDMDSATAPTITLTVNDADATSPAGTITKTISASDSPINTRTLYVAAKLRAEATPDGGRTWRTWTPGAGDVISTPPVAAGTFTLFGLSNGKLIYSTDGLLTAPTEAEDFGSAVNCIWINEVDPDRVTVGLADGRIMLTVDMSLVGSSTWIQLVDFGNPVLDLVESFEQQGQYRATTGETELLTYDSWATYGQPATFSGGTARQIATSPFSNYVSATHADEVKREDGTPITGISNSDVRAIAHHIRDDRLFAVNLAGQSYEKPPGSTAFTAKVAIGASGANHMINDGDNQEEFYVAHDNGLYKTYDSFTSIYRMRDYTGAGLDGLKVGRASLSLTNPAGLGLRVVVAGLSDGAPRFGYTNDYRTGNWIANNSGLPGSATTVKYLRLDPFNRSSTAFLIVDDILYKNTNYRGGGSWASIFDPPGSIADVELSIAEPGLIAALNGGSGDDLEVSHSHDLGVTAFQRVFVTDAAISVASMRFPLIVGQHNPSFMAIGLSSGSFNFAKSANEGHVWTPSLEFTDADNYNFWLPYVGNSSQQELFAVLGDGTVIRRSLDAGATWSLYSSPALPGASGSLEVVLFASPSNSDLVWGFPRSNTFDGLGAGARLYKSTNRALTFSSVTLTDFRIQDASLLRNERWYLAGHPVSSSKYVQTSEDYNTLVDRTGNLLASVFTGTNPSVTQIAVDSGS